MNSIRRSLNLLTALALVLLAIALAWFMSNGEARNPIPVTFLVLFAAAPALGHVVVTVLAWQRSPSSRSRAALGLGMASICCFVGVLVWAMLLELILKQQLGLSVPIAALGAGLLVLPISGAVNIAHFRSALVHAAP